MIHSGHFLGEQGYANSHLMVYMEIVVCERMGFMPVRSGCVVLL